MYTYEIIDLVNSQKGTLRLEQIKNILDNSPQVMGVLEDGDERYKYVFWTHDKIEPILFNIHED